MKKLLNFRLPFVSLIAVILGVVVARLVVCFSEFQFLLPVIIFIVAINLLVLCITIGKNYFKTIIYSCMVLTMFVMSVCSGLFHSSCLNKDLELIEEGCYKISGEVFKVDYDNKTLTLKSIYIEDLDITSCGSARVYLTDTNYDEVIRGDKIELVAYVYVKDINNSISVSGQTITAYAVSGAEVKVCKSESFKSKLKRNIYAKLLETNSNEETRELEFSMLFGDKDRLDDSVREVYSVTGLAHILAVSGLHVGLVVSVVFLFTKRLLKGRYFISLCITAAIAVFYLYLCDFTISAVRAVLMTVIIYYARARGKLYDGLCGISLAGIAILIVNPFELFDVGFELSFSVVFSLFALTPPTLRFFKNYLPEKLASSLAICSSTFVGSTLIIAYYFNSCSVLAILSNFIIIPIVSISFMILFVLVLITCVIPWVKFMLIVPNFLFDIINIVVRSIANIKFASVLLSTNILGVVLGLLAIFVLSDYVFLSRKQKAVVVGILVCIIGMTVVSEVYDILGIGG